jgi:FkbM family methyltransferase
MIATTKTKVVLASLAYRIIHSGRSLIGRGDWVRVRRGQIEWHLDLKEGIDFSIYLLGAFERSTAATLERLVEPGDVVFDIGANIGAHTLALARSVGPSGRVVAFEPTDFAFAKLLRNLALNPELAQRVRALQVQLADQPSAPRELEIYASWPLEANGHVHAKHRGRLVTARNASVDTLENLVAREGIDRLDLIKIDVDGHEYPVLRGARAILARFQPVLVMEVSPYVHAEQKHRFGDLIALLRELGYSLQDAATWKPLPLQSETLEALIPDGAGINVIARTTADRGDA